MPTPLSMVRDINGLNTFGLPFATAPYKSSTTLAANTAQSVTVPSDLGNALAVFAFEPGATVWVARNTTAAKPGNSFATTASEMNPTSRYVQGGDTISFITGDTSAQVGVIFLDGAV